MILEQTIEKRKFDRTVDIIVVKFSCDYCKKEFTLRGKFAQERLDNKGSHFCSNQCKCSNLKGFSRICSECDKEYCGSSRAKYCRPCALKIRAKNLVQYSNCLICGVEIIKNDINKFCSKKCYYKNKKNKQEEKRKISPDKICLLCNKNFKHLNNDVKFCSRNCVNQYHAINKTFSKPHKIKKGIFKPCPFCKKDVYYQQSEIKKERKKFCNRKCMDEYIKIYGVNIFFPLEERKKVAKKRQQTIYKKYGTKNILMDCKYKTLSKQQKYLYEKLKEHFPLIESPNKLIRTENANYYGDIVLEEQKIVIEYNGDYWHCNPKFYDPDYFNKKVHLTALEIWEKDEKRKIEIEKVGYKVLTIWEEDFGINKEETLKNLLEDIEKYANKTTKEI